MTVAKKIITPAQLTNAAATYYTAPANTKCVIKKLTFTNTSAAPVTVTVYLVPAAGAAGVTNCIWYQVTIPAAAVAVNPTRECYEAENQVLEAGDFLQALAATGAVITIQGAGTEIS